MKKCSKCKILYKANKDNFHGASKNKSGLRAVCKSCIKKEREDNKDYYREYNKKYRKKNKQKLESYYEVWASENKENIKVYRKRYYLDNKDYIISKSSLYAEKNKLKVKNYQASHYQLNKEFYMKASSDYYKRNKKEISIKSEIYRNENKERIALWQKNYRLKHPEIERLATQKRRSLKASLPNTLTIKEWEETKTFFSNSCAYCGFTEENHLRFHQELIHQDHLIPISKGGGYTKANIVPACRTCNSKKSNREFGEWYKKSKHYCPKSYEKVISFVGEHLN